MMPCLVITEDTGIILQKMEMLKLVLELFGDKRGCSSGLGGSMHVAELEKNIIGSMA